MQDPSANRLRPVIFNQTFGALTTYLLPSPEHQTQEVLQLKKYWSEVDVVR
jgi:hypothetical protein